MIKFDARRILVVDDTPAIHADFCKILKNVSSEHQSLNATRDLLFGETPSQESPAWHVDWAHQGEEGIAKVQRALEAGKPYSVAFVDMRMPPGLNGLDTTQRIWQLDPEVLVVLCTAYTDFTWKEIITQLGTSDRLLILKKPFESIEVRQMALALSQRWSIARTDPLTGVLNRRALLEHLQRWWLQTNHGQTLACAMVDLDHFKRINDAYGHQAGDAVLVESAKLLSQHARPQDIVARYGGEEFCVLMPGADEAAAARWAEEFRVCLKRTTMSTGGRSLAVTASIGIALRTSDTSSAAKLIEAADDTLYIAKRRGRDRVVTQSQVAANATQLHQTENSPLEESRIPRAEDIMSHSVRTLHHSVSLEQAANLMLRARVSSMVVVDDNDRLAGTFSEADALQAAICRRDWDVPVKDIMQTNVIRFDAAAPVQEIADSLVRYPFRKIVVTKQQRPVGTIGRMNLIRWLANSNRSPWSGDSANGHAPPAHEVEDYVVELLRQLRTECGALLDAADWDQADFDTQITEHAAESQTGLTV